MSLTSKSASPFRESTHTNVMRGGQPVRKKTTDISAGGIENNAPTLPPSSVPFTVVNLSCNGISYTAAKTDYDMQSKIKSLEQTVTERDATISKLTSEYSRKEAELEKNNAKLRAQVNSLEECMDSVNSKHRNATREVTTLETKLDRTTNELAKLQAMYDSECSRHNEEIERLERSLFDERDKFEASESWCNEWITKYNNLNNDRSMMMASIRPVDDTVCRSGVGSHDQTTDRLISEVESLKQQNVQLAEAMHTLESLRREHEDSVEELAMMRSLEIKYNSCRDDNERLKNRLTKMDNVMAEQAGYKREISKLTCQVSQLESELSSLRHTKAEADDMLHKIQHEVGALRRESFVRSDDIPVIGPVAAALPTNGSRRESLLEDLECSMKMPANDDQNGMDPGDFFMDGAHFDFNHEPDHILGEGRITFGSSGEIKDMTVDCAEMDNSMSNEQIEQETEQIGQKQQDVKIVRSPHICPVCMSSVRDSVVAINMDIVRSAVPDDDGREIISIVSAFNKRLDESCPRVIVKSRAKLNQDPLDTTQLAHICNEELTNIIHDLESMAQVMRDKHCNDILSDVYINVIQCLIKNADLRRNMNEFESWMYEKYVQPRTETVVMITPVPTTPVDDGSSKSKNKKDKKIKK